MLRELTILNTGESINKRIRLPEILRHQYQYFPSLVILSFYLLTLRYSILLIPSTELLLCFLPLMLVWVQVMLTPTRFNVAIKEVSFSLTQTDELLVQELYHPCSMYQFILFLMPFYCTSQYNSERFFCWDLFYCVTIILSIFNETIEGLVWT